jgi:hypothetical protein
MNRILLEFDYCGILKKFLDSQGKIEYQETIEFLPNLQSDGNKLPQPKEETNVS